MAHISGTSSAGPRLKNITAYTGFGDVPLFTGGSEEYDQWAFQVKTFLATEDKAFRDYMRRMEDLDREVLPEDVEDYTLDRTDELTAERVAWMDDMLYTLLTLKVKGSTAQAVRNMADHDE